MTSEKLDGISGAMFIPGAAPSGAESPFSRSLALLLAPYLVVGAVGACAPDEAAFTEPTSTSTATLVPTETLALTDTFTPPPTETMVPTSTPAVPSPTASSPSQPSAVSITPLEQTLPAGASTSFSLNIPEDTDGASSPVHWSVEGLPPGATAEFLPDVDCDRPTLVIHTACSMPQGSHAIDVLSEVSQRTSAVRPTIKIAGSLTSSQSGSFTGSFAYGEETIDILRGGSSTLQYGPFTVLQSCESDHPRKLKVTVESATSDAGTPLVEPPSFSFLQSLVWPVPDEVQVIGSGAAFKPNAQEVAQSDGWTLEWDIEPGLYLLVFQRSPFEDSNPAEERPASVTYRVAISSGGGRDRER